MDLSEPLVLLPGLLILGVGRAARFDDLGVMPWILRLRYEKEITFVEPQQDLMLGRILAETRVPPLELVESLRLEEINAKPRPCLTLRTPRQNWGLGSDKLIGELEFEYDGAVIPAGRTTPLAVSTELGLVIRRDPRTESAADIKLFELGFREAKDPRLDPGTLELPAKRMSLVAKELVIAGWRVEAEGKLIRPAGEFKLALNTGIDWFELEGGIQYGDQKVSLPELLAAARSRRFHDRAGRWLDGHAAGRVAQEVWHARRSGDCHRGQSPVQLGAGGHARCASGRAAGNPGRRCF